MGTALSTPDLSDDLSILGKASRFVLREDQPVVDPHVKDTAAALNELSINAERFIQRGRQTDGLRFVVSHSAILDRNFHDPRSREWINH